MRKQWTHRVCVPVPVPPAGRFSGCNAVERTWHMQRCDKVSAGISVTVWTHHRPQPPLLVLLEPLPGVVPGVAPLKRLVRPVAVHGAACQQQHMRLSLRLAPAQRMCRRGLRLHNACAGTPCMQRAQGWAPLFLFQLLPYKVPRHMPAAAPGCGTVIRSNKIRSDQITRVL